MSKCTIVSYFPREFDERIPHIFPSRYFIPASDGINPKFLVVDDATYYLENWIGEQAQKIPIRIASEELANSLVSDFRQSLIKVAEDSYPAVFWLAGEVDITSLQKQYKSQMEAAIRCQKNWFTSLVREADDLWEKFHQHRAIGTMERLAAKNLLLDRPWISFDAETVKCPACHKAVNPSQAVCTNCRCIINKEAYKKLEFASAVG